MEASTWCQSSTPQNAETNW